VASDWVADPDEHLADGWERDLPSDDNLLRAYTDAFVEMVEAVARAGRGRVLHEDEFAASDTGSPVGYLNAAVLLAPLSESRAEAVVARVTSFFEEGQGGPWTLFSATPTPDLRSYGVKPVGHPPLMLRTPGGDRPPPPPDLEIVHVADAETLRTFEQTAIHAYPMPELEAAGAGGFMPASLLDDDTFRFFVGFVDGQAVSTSMAHLGGSITHVEYVTTMPAVRGRGYGEAMTWPATLVDPAAPSMLIASDLGRPIYERMGYLTVARFTLGAGARAKGEEG
jgi:hypothetical protein